MITTPAFRVPRQVLVLALALLLGACKPTLDVELTLAPAAPDQARSVVLGIDGLELRDENNDERRLSSSSAVDANLLDFRDTRTLALLNGEQLPTRRYTGIRLQFADQSGQIINTDNQSFDVDIDDPSELDFADIDISFKGSETGNLLLELDLRFSLLQKADDKFRFRPYLRALDPDKAGSLTGRIDADLFDNECDADETPVTAGTVYLFEGSDASPQDFFSGGSGNPIASTTVQAISGSVDFSYDFSYVAAGRYTLALTCQAGNEDPFVRDGNDEVPFFANRTAINIDEKEAQIVDLTN
jgi:hypothetical protein